MNVEFFNFSIELQVALASGYLAYATAYSGLKKNHRAIDSTMITLAFGLIGAISFHILQSKIDITLAILVSILIALLSGAMWRKWVLNLWKTIIKRAGIHADDGFTNAWDSLIQTPNLYVTQITVYLIDGTEYYCEDTSKYTSQVENGLKLGSDGSITMITDKVKEAGSNQDDDISTTVDPEWGARLTYVPASQIKSVVLRSKVIS